jgi:hypothetical protein
VAEQVRLGAELLDDVRTGRPRRPGHQPLISTEFALTEAQLEPTTALGAGGGGDGVGAEGGGNPDGVDGTPGVENDPVEDQAVAGGHAAQPVGRRAAPRLVEAGHADRRHCAEVTVDLGAPEAAVAE